MIETTWTMQVKPERGEATAIGRLLDVMPLKSGQPQVMKEKFEDSIREENRFFIFMEEA